MELTSTFYSLIVNSCQNCPLHDGIALNQNTTTEISVYFALHSVGEGARIEIYWVIIPKAVVVHNPAPSMEVGTHNFWSQRGMSIWKVPGIMTFGVFKREKLLLVSVVIDGSVPWLDMTMGLVSELGGQWFQILHAWHMNCQNRQKGQTKY